MCLLHAGLDSREDIEYQSVSLSVSSAGTYQMKFIMLSILSSTKIYLDYFHTFIT